jgi:hypothetical protein
MRQPANRIGQTWLGVTLGALLLMSLPAVGGCAFGGSSSGAVACLTNTVSGQLVGFQVSGGFAGVDDRLTIDKNGVATLTHRGGKVGSANLSEPELNQLKRALANAEFQALKPKYFSPNAYDSFEYTLTYSCRVVTADEGSIPRQLGPVIDQLRALATRVGSR